MDCKTWSVHEYQLQINKKFKIDCKLKSIASNRGCLTTLNIPIIEDGTNSSHMHNLAKSQSY